MTYRNLMNKKWFIWLMLFGLIQPSYMLLMMPDLMRILRGMSHILVLIGIATSIRKHIYKPYNIALLCLWLSLLISTVRTDVSSLFTYYTNLRSVIIVCLLIEVLAIYSPVNGLHCLYGYFSACVLINTLTFFLVPNGMWNDAERHINYFLGDDNSGYSYYIVASILAMINCKYINKRVTVVSVIVWISGFIFAFGGHIGSGMICQAILSMLFLIYHFRWLRKKIKARYVLYVALGGFLLLVIFRSSIIEPIAAAVGKSVTLTGRTIIWDNLLKSIKERWLLGFGIRSNEMFNSIINTIFGSAHNYILQIIFWGGISAAILFALMVFFACKVPKKDYQSDYCKFVIIGLIVVFVRLLVESGVSIHLYMLLTMLAYSHEIVSSLQSSSKTCNSVIIFPKVVIKSAKNGVQL